MKLSILCSLCKCALTGVSVYIRHVNGYQRGICGACRTQLYPVFTYNKENIQIQSIDAFHPSMKSNNDKNNKMRESIIGAIINQKVPSNYFEDGEWLKLQTQVATYIHKLFENTQCASYNSIECKHMGGRKYNYDFQIHVRFQEQTEPVVYNVELKYNANTIDDTPQFVSPVKPSQYMISTDPNVPNQSYEEYYYETYLQTLCDSANIELPSKPDYLAQIHGTEPKCVKPLQELYYKGCAKDKHYTGEQSHIAVYELAKTVSKNSIKQYIETHDLNVELLNTYLHTSQSNKIYMLYSIENGFAIQYPNMDDYKIESFEKKENKYVCTCKSGNKMNVLLRWKNGNGIAFPAFQIS